MSSVIVCTDCKNRLDLRKSSLVDAVDRLNHVAEDEIEDAVDEESDDISEVAIELEFNRDDFLKRYLETFRQGTRILGFLKEHTGHKVSFVSGKDVKKHDKFSSV